MRACEPADRLIGPRAARRILLALACGLLLLLCLGWYSDIDLLLADRIFDRQHMLFPWRHAWLAERFSHTILKGVLAVAGVLLIVAALADAVCRFHRLDRHRLRLRVVALSAVLVPLVISVLKQSSDAHCPWDLARYGGAQPYVRLFGGLPAGVAPGHCFPAGHASSALWLVSLAVFWLPHRPGRAALAAAAGLSAGIAAGWMQQLRGAHFLTHTLWSAWIAAAVVFMVAVVAPHARLLFIDRATRG